MLWPIVISPDWVGFRRDSQAGVCIASWKFAGGVRLSFYRPRPLSHTPKNVTFQPSSIVGTAAREGFIRAASVCNESHLTFPSRARSWTLTHPENHHDQHLHYASYGNHRGGNPHRCVAVGPGDCLSRRTLGQLRLPRRARHHQSVNLLRNVIGNGLAVPE